MKVEIERHLPLSSSQIITLIEEVDDYPLFVPGVKEILSIDRRRGAQSTEINLEARIGFRVVTGKVRVNIVTDRAKRRAVVRMARGPLKKGECVLSFEDMRGGARALVVGEYDTPFAAFQTAIEQKFGSLADTALSAIQQRARTRFAA